MSKIPLVSIIAPAHNEEKIIEGFLSDVTKACKELDLNYEFIIIENGSKDKTYEKVNNYVKSNDKVRLIKLETAGYGLAMIKGLKHVRGEYIVFLNIDFWDKKFLEITKADLLSYDIVSGSKLLPGSKDHRGFSRKFVTLMYTMFLRVGLGFKGTDTHGIKAMRTIKIMPVVKNCKTSSGIFDSELIIRCQRANLKILELPVEVKEVRPPRFSFKRLLNTPLDIIRLFNALQN